MVGTQPSGFANLGIEADDFINGPLADFGQTVGLESQTGTVDTFGGRTEGFGASTNITAVFLERSKNKVRNPDGTMIESPAYLMAKITDSVGTGDKVTADGRKWRTFNVINRKGIYTYHDLFLWEK